MNKIIVFVIVALALVSGLLLITNLVGQRNDIVSFISSLTPSDLLPTSSPTLEPTSTPFPTSADNQVDSATKAPTPSPTPSPSPTPTPTSSPDNSTSTSRSCYKVTINGKTYEQCVNGGDLHFQYP